MNGPENGKVPKHLRKYIVAQNYARYSAEDQAVWRYIMRQLKSFLSHHAHPIYLEGLKKTGLDVDKIPHIDHIDQLLETVGWGAVAVSGFIPPAAFMEFQSLGILPIACDMRTLDHLLYTPAPDIVHEAAGHAPIIAAPEYAAYLRHYGSVARLSIISKEDLAQYAAIRHLSDIKENPNSSTDEIAQAEKALIDISRSMKHVSEAALLSRMNWWTAEYGLIGSLENPKIFGAGLLSSVGEARACLDSKVTKIPLSIKCIDYAYDITEPQPQLFVAEDFVHLALVLEDLCDRLSFRRGGAFGLERAIEAGTVNSVQLNSGVQISGVLNSFLVHESQASAATYLKFTGPAQLSHAYSELSGQGQARHQHGYSTPVGRLKNHTRCMSFYSENDLANLALKRGARARLQFESGVQVEGILKDWIFRDNRLILMTWNDCKVSLGEQILFDPSWGEYDMAVGSVVESVFGGPADRASFQTNDEFNARRVPARALSERQKVLNALYQEIRELRSNPSSGGARSQFASLLSRVLLQSEWLLAVELLELSFDLDLEDRDRVSLNQALNSEKFLKNSTSQACIRAGMDLAGVKL